MTVLKTQLYDNGIFHLILNRPEKYNALNKEVFDALSEAFTQAKENAAVKAVLLSGEGRAFCAGADIHRLSEVNAQEGYVFAKEGQAIFQQLETLGKPSLAAIHGLCLGGGCELSMSASLRIASKSAQFGQPEVKLGILPGYGGVQRLARLVGKGRALDLCLTARFILVEEALSWGLITEITEEATLLARATVILEGIIAMAPLALRSVLEVMNHGYDMNLSDALHLEAVHFGLTCATQDKKEGINAFLEKRPANFRGE